MGTYIGIDLGATRIKAIATDHTGNMLAKFESPTRDSEDAPWVEAVREAANTLEREQACTLDGVALCAPGLVNRNGRSIAWMQGRMASLQDLDWSDALSRPIQVLNDAHAALLGEAWVGAAQGCQNAVLLTLGTGVGGAVMCDGHVLRGHLGRAGHLGHISLDPDAALDIVNTPGSLEDAIGECTLDQRSNGKFQATSALLEAIDAGDDTARTIWDRSIYLLACGIASIINVCDPEVVVIGGGISLAGDRLFAPLRTHLQRVEWRPSGAAVELRPAKLGPLAGAFGAAYHARSVIEGD